MRVNWKFVLQHIMPGQEDIVHQQGRSSRGLACNDSTTMAFQPLKQLP